MTIQQRKTSSREEGMKIPVGHQIAAEARFLGEQRKGSQRPAGRITSNTRQVLREGNWL